MPYNFDVPDYISTDPWNTPENPWPLNASLTLATAEISSRTFTLSVFNPNTPNLQYYSSPGGQYRLAFNGAWRIYSNSSALYTLSSSIHEIQAVTPATSASNENGAVWEKNGGLDPASIVITPNYDDMTPWTRRRMWNLNG